MTEAKIKLGKKDAEVKILGHAGDDLVCAAISTIAGAMLNVLGDDAYDIVYEPGHVEFKTHRPSRESLGAIRVLTEALTMLSETFPDKVGVTLTE